MIRKEPNFFKTLCNILTPATSFCCTLKHHFLIPFISKLICNMNSQFNIHHITDNPQRHIKSGYEFLPLLQIQDTFVATHQYLENQHQLFPSEPLQHTATFMLLDEQNITRQSVNTMLHEHQMQLGHILEVSSMDLLIQFAQVGLGIACVIKEFVQNDLDKEILVEAPLGLTFPSREIGFVCKKGSENQKLLTQLAEI